MKITIIDIETGAANDAENFKPVFEAAANLKDPEKIKAAIAENYLSSLRSLPVNDTLQLKVVPNIFTHVLRSPFSARRGSLPLFLFS